MDRYQTKCGELGHDDRESCMVMLEEDGECKGASRFSNGNKELDTEVGKEKKAGSK